jgi:hypothetical protein
VFDRVVRLEDVPAGYQTVNDRETIKGLVAL